MCGQGMAMLCRGIACEEWTQYANVANETGASYNVSFLSPVSQVNGLHNNGLPPTWSCFAARRLHISIRCLLSAYLSNVAL